VCGAEVVHLPRHLRDIHKWEEKKARQHRELNVPSYSGRKLPFKDCPIPGCSFRTDRIDKHLRRKHKVTSDLVREQSLLASRNARMKRQSKVRAYLKSP